VSEVKGLPHFIQNGAFITLSSCTHCGQISAFAVALPQTMQALGKNMPDTGFSLFKMDILEFMAFADI
jgi:hypothetical protein